MTALMLACGSGKLDIVMRLLDFKAVPGRKDNDGLTSYNYALQSGHMNIADTIRSYDPSSAIHYIYSPN